MAVEACGVVGRFVARHGGPLPSIYLERGGVLRCAGLGERVVVDLDAGAGRYSNGLVELPREIGRIRAPEGPR